MELCQHRWFNRDIYKAYWWKSAALELNPCQGLLHLGSHDLTVDELANVAGDLQFRMMANNSNIVDLFNSGNTSKKNCFVMRMKTGNPWANSIGLGKDLNSPIDVMHLEFGRDIPHNTLPPSKAVYIWLRTA